MYLAVALVVHHHERIRPRRHESEDIVLVLYFTAYLKMAGRVRARAAENTEMQ